MAKQTEYKLKSPVVFGGDEHHSVTIKYKLNFLRGCVVPVGVKEDKSTTLNIDMGQLVDLAAKMIGQVPAFLDELGDDDQAHILSEANSFLLSRLGTGPSS